MKLSGVLRNKCQSRLVYIRAFVYFDRRNGKEISISYRNIEFLWNDVERLTLFTNNDSPWQLT